MPKIFGKVAILDNRGAYIGHVSNILCAKNKVKSTVMGK